MKTPQIPTQLSAKNKFDIILQDWQTWREEYPMELSPVALIVKETARGYALTAMHFSLNDEASLRRIYLPAWLFREWTLLGCKSYLLHEVCHHLVIRPRTNKEIHGEAFRALETSFLLAKLSVTPWEYDKKDQYGVYGYYSFFKDLNGNKIDKLERTKLRMINSR